jgi:hypothetical protein
VKMKLSLVLLMCVLPLGSTISSRLSSITDKHLATTSLAFTTAPCLTTGELDELLNDLRAHTDGPMTVKGRNSLINGARQSHECRARVIEALIVAMQQSSREPNADQRRYSLWDNGADVLAELRANEALDLLIANLDLTDGSSISLSHYPAVGAVIAMGETAIPKLELVLSQDRNPYKRKSAVFCVASIGGAKAKDVLTKALNGERDPCVKRVMLTSLSMMSSKVKPNRLPDDNGKLMSAFYCINQ